MVTIEFESHATTKDNEIPVASGWYDVELSTVGQDQAKQLGERLRDEHYDAIFCSDLQRSYKTAEIAFGPDAPIIQDRRLRECDYGDLTRAPSKQIEELRKSALTTPYPGGESFQDTSARMKSFLSDLLRDYDGKRVLIVGHRATQYGLEEHVKGLPLESVVLAPWKWQPGWTYELSLLA